MSAKKIHFVCLGNAFRSRLAEAYAQSLNLKGFEFSSSGVAAHLFEQRLPKHAEVPAKQNGLAKHLSSGQRQTTSELLAKQDLIVLMKRDIYKEAKKQFDFDDRKVIIWNIDDMWQTMRKHRLKDPNTDRAIKLSLEIFAKIKYHVDNLAQEITAHKWIDIVDENNKHTDLKLPVSMANEKGLWHRSVHATAVTPDGQYVVQKRSSSATMSKSLLDISLGGYVDGGEHPDAAVVRETNEELGIKIDASQVHFLQITHAASYHPHYKTYTKGYIYNYLIKLRPNQLNFKPDPDEIEAVYLISSVNAKKLIRLHHLRHFGRLNYPYKLYESNLDLVEKLA